MRMKWTTANGHLPSKETLKWCCVYNMLCVLYFENFSEGEETEKC